MSGYSRHVSDSLILENRSLRERLVALEDEKNNYIEYVGDALGQSEIESLWDAAQRVLSERDALRAQLAAETARLDWTLGVLVEGRPGDWVYRLHTSWYAPDSVNIKAPYSPRDVIDRLLGEVGNASA